MDLFNSPDFASHVDELIKSHRIPGLAVAITHKDATASKAFGMASFDPPVKMTCDTLFDIASASKSVTAASVALLIADEMYPDITWDAEMAKVLPGDFVMPGEGYEGVTVEDMLSHRTGLAPNDNSYLGPRSDHTDNARSVTRNLRNLATAAPIRSKFMYCNMMFTVATYLVEQKSGMSFADFIEERFFKPLGMESSNLQPERARAKGLGDRLTPGHWWDPAAKKYATFKTPDAPEAQGAGSIVTSVTDYLKYVKAMMNKEAPFTEEIYNGLIKGRIIIEPSYEHLNPFCAAPLYAAGWEVHYYRGHQIIVHDGCISGSSTSHFFVPDLNFAGAIFGNADSASYIAEIILYELLDELLEIPKSQRVSWPKVLYEKWSEGKEYEDRDPDDPAVDAEMRRKEEEEELEKLCPGLKDLEPQTMPLEAYTGSYYHVGWKGLTVEIKDGQLFIDCTDRSYVFNLTLKHVCEQTKYLVDMREVSQGPGYTLRAEFRFENDRAVKLGIVWDGDLDEFIWFHRVDGGEAKGLAVRAKGDDA